MADRPLSDESRIEDLARRVARLEVHLGLPAEAAPPPEPTPTIPLVPPTVPSGPGAAHPPTETESIEEPTLAGARAVPPPVEAPALASGLLSKKQASEFLSEGVSGGAFVARTPARAKAERVGLEQAIGGRWFGLVGAVIILIGVGLFIKWAYDQGWVSQAAQCLIVAGFGGLLLGAGEFVRRRVGRVASIGPSAAGLGALFFATFAAREIYGLVSVEAAMALMIGTTLFGLALAGAVRLASLAGVAMIGGYLAPVVLSTGEPSPVFMPGYLVGLLAVGAGLSAWFSALPEARQFRTLRTLGWWGTVLFGSLWVGTTGYEVPRNGLVFLAGVWLVVHAEMVLTSFAPMRVRPGVEVGEDEANSLGLWRSRWIAGSFASTAWVGVVGVLLMLELNPLLDWVVPAGLGGMCAVIAGLVLTLDPLPDVLRRGAQNPREQLGAGLLVQTGALVIAGVALGIGGWAQVAVWLALGVGAVGAGRWVRSGALYVYGLIVLSIAAARLLTWDLMNAFGGPVGWDVGGLALGGWSTQMGLAGVAWLVSAVLILSGGSARGAHGRGGWRAVGIICACVGYSLLALLPVHEQSVPGSIAVWWALVGLGAVVAGRRNHVTALVWYGAGVMGCAAFGLFVIGAADGFDGAVLRRIAGLSLSMWTVHMGLVALAWLLAAAVTIHERGVMAAFARVSVFLGGGLLALMPAHAESDPYALATWFAVLGVVGLALNRVDRRFALDVFGLCVTMAGIVPWVVALQRGWTETDAAPGLHPGLGVAIVMVVVSLVGGLLVKRGVGGVGEEAERRLLGLLGLVFAGALLFVATSLEVGRVAEAVFPDETSRAAVLSIWWGLYGICVLALGFVRRAAPVRYVGLGLLGVAAAKAVVFDLSQVSMGWRVASFVGLGLLMVGVAVVYQRLAIVLVGSDELGAPLEHDDPDGRRRRSGRAAGSLCGMARERHVRLLVACEDRPGIIAAVTSMISVHGGNIVDVDQHSDKGEGQFFMRLELERESVDTDREGFVEAFGPVAREFEMTWRVEWGDRPKRMAIMVSREVHCLSDLLYRWRTGELDADIPLVVSNHEAAREWVETVGIPFHHLPVSAKEKPAQEGAVRELLRGASIDVVVLARYMQILSPGFVGAYPSGIINIHHSFLPAFAGARPYHRAHERGVKIIGATSHYVTEALDEGPIIAQTTAGVDHRDTVEDMIRTGRDIERITLAHAVRLHVEDRVLVSGNKTVVFEK